MIMKYNGYFGSQEVSVEDDVLHGKLLHIRDLVTYEAETPKGLEAAFHEAVDAYLSDCEADGVEPDKPFKGQFNVRITPELHRQLAEGAREQDCTLNQYVSHILHEHENRGYTRAMISKSFEPRPTMFVQRVCRVAESHAAVEVGYSRAEEATQPYVFRKLLGTKRKDAIQ